MNILGEAKKTDNGLIKLILEQKELKISEELIFDILSLPYFNLCLERKLELLKELIKNGLCNQTIQMGLSNLIAEGYILSIQNIKKDLIEIANAVYELRFNIDSELISDFAYILEEVYAKGIDVRKEIVMLLKSIDINSSSRIVDNNVIVIKMALVAYGTNEYNFGEKMKELDHYADLLKSNKLKELKPAMHYYYAVFKERFPNCWSTMYNKDKHTSYGHLVKSRRAMFRLAEIKYNHC